MARKPKLFISGTLVELSARVEQGLPFAPNILISTLIINALARAQNLYPVRIVSFVILGNHFHILIIVQDPSNVPKFMEYFKRETGHYVNRLLGRRKHTVWSAGFSDPVILDHEKALERLKYVYLNPVKAGRCEHSSNWPLSSMNWIKENRNLTVKRIPRDNVAKLPKRSMTLEEIEKAHSKLSFRGKELFTLKLEPDAWIECYIETKNTDVKSYNDYLSLEIKREEEKFKRERPCPPTPLHIQATQNIRTEYQPQKFGKNMICLGSTKEIRVKFLDWYKTQCKKLPHFLKKVKNDIAQLSHYPPGFFAPGGFLSSNLIPSQTPFSELG